MARRNRLDLYAKMLELFETPRTQSMGIDELSLSGSQSKRYFSHLLRKRLLAQAVSGNGAELYTTSEKGHEFLLHYYAMKEMLGE